MNSAEASVPVQPSRPGGPGSPGSAVASGAATAAGPLSVRGSAAEPVFTLRWERREPPLPAAAVLALGDAVPALAAAARARLLAGARLGTLADAGALLVLGAAGDLPWADGARYLGRDGDLLVPTTARPLPAAALWPAALGARRGQVCVLLPGHAMVADPPPLTTDPAALDRFLPAEPDAGPRPDAVPAPGPAPARTGPGPAAPGSAGQPTGSRPA
ncbi:hypothetical protein [Streptomyces sp. NRRL B-24484]|uniref:bpX5 domain-containing protein n=1 Tax=Streptomyces sp. NRRL B-24484 TaxID=1463833 RepID=UPI000694CE3A|nr:hypothetical protein [Streptomyces sp. NRRL B-24484]